MNMLKDQGRKKEYSGVFSALSLAFELGYIITIPIVGFALGGRLLDRKLDTSPLFILLGISISIILTSYLVHRKIAKIIEDM